MTGSTSNSSVSSGRIEVAPGLFLPRSAVRFTFSRGGGPGGQNVNKVSTRVQLRIALVDLQPRLGPAATARLRQQAATWLTAGDELLIGAEQSRSQAANRRACMDRLRLLLIEARKRPRRRIATRPSSAARRRRVDDKTHHARIKRQRRAPDESS